jgi:hypothetical protein
MVVEENATIVKKGVGGTRFGRRLCYLSIHELLTHSCAICKTIKLLGLRSGIKRAKSFS